MQQRYYLDKHFLGKGLVPKPEVTEAPEKEAASEEPEQTGTLSEAEVSEETDTEPSGAAVENPGDAEGSGTEEEPQEKGLSEMAKRLLMVMAAMMLLLFFLCMLLAAKLRKRNNKVNK